MTDDEYETHIDRVIIEITTDPMKYPTAHILAGQLHPDHPANVRVMRAAKVAGISAKQLETAILQRKRAADKAIERQERAAKEAEKQAKEAERLEAEAERIDRVNAELGASVATEREFVRAFLENNGWAMSYGGLFEKGTEECSMEDMANDLILTASDLGLTKKPLSLKDKNFERALTEYYKAERARRKAAIWQTVAEPLAGENAPAIINRWYEVASYFFKDGDLSAAAVMKVMWSVKRKMLRMPVPYHHFVVFYSGKQGSGKSSVWGFIKTPISDLCKDPADVADLVSNAQLDMFNYALLEVPEMSGAEKADIAKLKSIVTASTVSRRVFFTQSVRDVYNSATFVGTCNLPLATLLKDSTGMRRFVQCDVKPLTLNPHWDQIKNFDYAALWRAVDHTGPDPLTDYADELTAKQDKMRNRDRVETWVEDFEDGVPPLNFITATSKPPFYQFHAKDLYRLYRAHEAENASGSGMTLTNWGLRMKALIEDGQLNNWAYHEHGRRTLYDYRRSADVVAIAHSREAKR